MGRVKIARKSTFIDMTAMSDVTVLLLTFFMLTSTFLQKEPTTVVTPPSVSTEKVQETNFVQVLVSPEGKVWLTMNNDTSSAWSNEKMRMALLDKVSEIYNESHKNKVSFNIAQKEAFSKLGSFGVPLQQMGEFLNLADQQEGQTKMDKWMQGEDDDRNHVSGIPISWNSDESTPNEFQMWMKALRQTENETLAQAIKDGTGVAIKADQNTSFDIIHMVMDNLQTSVDFTPMVDMNMLLITFFMLCTTMIKSQTLTIALPSNEKVENQENMSQASADDAVTIIIDAKRKAGSMDVDSVNGKVVNEVYYYFGKPGGDAGIFGPGGVVLSENNNIQKSEFLSDEINSAGDHSARGIRQIIQQRNKEVLTEINKIKEKYAKGEFGSLETKDGREKAQAAYDQAASEIRKSENLKKPVVIIKSTPQASFGSLVEILDEMQINSISKYQIDNMTRADSVMLIDFQNRNHAN